MNETGRNDDSRPKVAVIGAGISGLAAAASLVEKGFYVYLLEASDYIGGRLKQAEAFPGFPPVDLGGDFIHGSSNILHQIAKENGWKVKEELDKPYVYIDGKFYYFNDDCTHPDVHSAFKAWNNILKYGQGENLETKETNIKEADERPPALTTCRNQDQVFGVSVGTWLSNKGFDQNVIDILNSFYGQKYAVPLNTAGVLEIATWEVLRAKIYGSGNYRLEGSYSLLISHYMNKCKNVDKRLNWPVKQIKWKDNLTSDHASPKSTVHITSQSGETLHVNYAVIAVPLSILKDGDLFFLPPLPATKQKAIQCIYMGSALKVVCRFKRRFWRETTTVTCPGSFLKQVWMYSRDPKPDGEECHIVVGFTTAFAAAQKVHLSDEEVCKRFVQQLDEMFGNGADPKPASRNLMNFVYHHWSKHPYIRGGYSSPTVSTHGLLKHLAEPVEGKLFFAGEATHPIPSTVQSALETGIRAADEVCTVYNTLKTSIL